MIAVGALFIWLAIKHNFEPLLLVPIGMGIIVGNIPFVPGMEVGLYEEGSVLNIFYQGVRQGWYPPLIFLGIGAMTDFSALISNPKLILIGAAAQFGIFGAYMIALALGFEPNQAASIAIIGGADGPTAIFLSSKLCPSFLGAIAVCAYSYMALVPVLQPVVMRLLTTKKERVIKMKPGRQVSQTERILFPIIEGKRKDRPSGKDSNKCFEQRYRDTSRSHCRLLYTGKCIPHYRHHQDFLPWCSCLHHCNSQRCTLREVYEPVPVKG